MPYPVTVGFTAGIAVIILASQLKELLGLTLAAPEPGPIVPKMEALAAALPSANLAAVAVAAGTVGVILAVRRWRPRLPSLPDRRDTGLARRLGARPAGGDYRHPVRRHPQRAAGAAAARPLARPRVDMLPAALSFALLGGIESLLSAVVADSITGRRHRSNCELVAQGVANVASALFGGICVTGTIARTATNVRAGARGPVAGMSHSVFLLLFMLAAAPLAAFIPLSALAALLAVVAWNMAEKHEIATLAPGLAR